MNRYKNITKKRRFAVCNNSLDTIKVQSNLTLTPAQMYGFALQGKPISTFQLPAENFDDGLSAEATDIEVPLEEKRGIDVNDLYQNFKDVGTKFKSYRSKKYREKLNE